MKRLISFLIILTLISCNKTKSDFYFSANKAGMFSHMKPYIISFDTIRDFKDFKTFSNTIRDTISDCALLCGFIYNYQDSSFVPNSDKTNNIVITSFDIVSNHCTVSYFTPSMEIFMNSNDSVEIFQIMDSISQKFNIHGEDFNNAINLFYKSVFQSNRELSRKNYIHFVIPDTTDFKKHFLPCFRIIIRNYKNNYMEYLTKNNLNILDTSIFRWENDITQSFRFKLIIDDFDYRKIKYDYKQK